MGDEAMEGATPPPFGKRGRAPPIITHAPLGLGDVPPEPHSHGLRWAFAGAAALYAVIFAAAAFHQDCPHDDQSWGDSNTAHEQSCRHSGHPGSGGSGGAHAVSFGGFGGAGEGSGHGGGHGGGGE